MGARGKTWPQFCATIVISEIMPRIKKYNTPYTEIPVEITQQLAALEFTGKLERREHRYFLDVLFDGLKR